MTSSSKWLYLRLDEEEPSFLLNMYRHEVYGDRAGEALPNKDNPRRHIIKFQESAADVAAFKAVMDSLLVFLPALTISVVQKSNAIIYRCKILNDAAVTNEAEAVEKVSQDVEMALNYEANVPEGTLKAYVNVQMNKFEKDMRKSLSNIESLLKNNSGGADGAASSYLSSIYLIHFKRESIHNFSAIFGKLQKLRWCSVAVFLHGSAHRQRRFSL